MRPFLTQLLLGMVLLVLVSGCTGPEDDPLPETLNNAYSWGKVAFSGTVGELYAETALPEVSFTRIWLYFPGRAPGDPSRAQLEIRLRLEEESEPLPGTGWPDSSLVLGGPVVSPLDFDRDNYLYSGAIVPYVGGAWTLEFSWVGPEISASAYLPLDVEVSDTRRAVSPVGSISNLVVLAWVEPPKPIPGEQDYRMLAWHSYANTQRFRVDSTLTVLLTFPEQVGEAEVPDTSFAEWVGNAYVGSLSFPNLTNWSISASVSRDTSEVGEGSFLLDME